MGWGETKVAGRIFVAPVFRASCPNLHLASLPENDTIATVSRNDDDNDSDHSFVMELGSPPLKGGTLFVSQSQANIPLKPLSPALKPFPKPEHVLRFVRPPSPQHTPYRSRQAQRHCGHHGTPAASRLGPASRQSQCEGGMEKVDLGGRGGAIGTLHPWAHGVCADTPLPKAPSKKERGWGTMKLVRKVRLYPQ